MDLKECRQCQNKYLGPGNKLFCMPIGETTVRDRCIFMLPRDTNPSPANRNGFFICPGIIRWIDGSS